MAWALFVVPSSKKTELETALHEDQLSRQSQKVRDAASAGGPAGELYVLIEGPESAITHAKGLLEPLGKIPAPQDAKEIYQRLKDEEEAASAGMGLFFTE
jgi:hypothetical protein